MRESRFFGDRVFRRLPRETHEFPAQWSDWVLMLHDVRTKNWYQSYPRYVPRCEGVYEIAAGHKVVYVGCTSNLRRRFKSYCANGSHLARKLSKALKKHHRVWFRFAPDRGYKFTELKARALLQYPWNQA